MTVTQIFGPPGCGKTTELINILRQALDDGIHPSRVAVCSFSRKAINEFLDRALVQFGGDRKTFPHMRTLHSTAFHALGLRTEDVMSAADYKKLGDLLGETFVVNAVPDDGILTTTDFSKGSQYLAIIDRARYRMVPLEEEWRCHDTFEMSLSKCRQIYQQVELYKQKMMKSDFVDMIEMYVEQVTPPPLDMFILDEAQDLTPLQWKMAKKISAHATDTYTAGDDDQAIHGWAGARGKEFVEFGDEKRILTQSYRLPKKVFDLAARVVRRIEDRVPKLYHPTEEEGNVVWHYSLDGVPLDRGSWTLMTRTNYQAKLVATQLRNLGYYYALRGNPPISVKQGRAIQTWRTLTSGGSIDLQHAKDLYDQVPKQGDKAVVKRGAAKLFDAAAPDQMFTMEDLRRDYGLLVQSNLFGEIERDVFDILGLGNELATYLRHVEKAGEDLTKPPRIKLSTIHAMKGGEDDNCVLFTSTTKKIEESGDQDEEHRVFYVGITRTKKFLHIIQPPLYDGNRRNYRYEI